MFVYVAITIAVFVLVSAVFVVPHVARTPMNGEVKYLKRVDKQLERHHKILDTLKKSI